jgi:hypothetical protein
MVTLKVAVALFPAESFTCTPKVADPARGVVPVSAPPLDKLNPTVASAFAPEVTVHAYPVPDPPDAARDAE